MTAQELLNILSALSPEERQLEVMLRLANTAEVAVSSVFKTDNKMLGEKSIGASSFILIYSMARGS